MKTNYDKEAIKRIDIVEVAKYYNLDPVKKSNLYICKNNPLRDDGKNSSFTLYPSTNSFIDYGGNQEGGDVIKFVELVEHTSYIKALELLSDKFGVNYEVDYEIVTVEQTYMTPAAVTRAFSSPFHSDISLTNHKKHMLTVCPEYLPNEAEFEDKEFFFNIAKWAKNFNTSLYKLPDLHGVHHTFKYRYKSFGEDERKWVGLAGARAKYAYTRLTDNPITLILEGTRDFLNAVLCGYSVMAIPQAGYEFTIEEKRALDGRKCVFMDDDDGKDFILPLFDAHVGEKVLFNHAKFKETTKCDSKDFSDYLYQFKNLKAFQAVFDNFINQLEPAEAKSWEDDINIAHHVSLDFLTKAPDVEFLTENFIVKNTVTVLHSKPGVGKSSLLVAMIREWLNTNKIKKVIYFDGDNPLSVIKDRILRLKEEFGDKILYYSNSTAGIEIMKKEMERLCLFKDQGKDVLVIKDTLGKFIDGSVKNDSDVAPAVKLITRLRDEFGCTGILVHHSNKATDDDGNGVFQGSQKIMADTDATFGMRREGNIIHIKQNKVRFGEMFENIKVELNLKDLEITSFNGSYAADFIESADEVTVDAQNINLVEYLQGKDLVTISEVQKHFGCHRNKDKRDMIWNMVKEDNNIKLEKQGNGWRCKLNGNAPQITQYVPKIYSEVEIPDIS